MLVVCTFSSMDNQYLIDNEKKKQSIKSSLPFHFVDAFIYIIKYGINLLDSQQAKYFYCYIKSKNDITLLEKHPVTDKLRIYMS